MRFTSLEKNIMGQLSTAIRDVTPGVLVRAYYNGRSICDISAGQVFPYYDLASLTKPIFVVQAMMLAFDQGLWKIDSRAKDFASWLPFENLTLVQLLTHTSGLKAWEPYYQKLMLASEGENAWLNLKALLKLETMQEPDKAVYSDLNFFILGFILEEIFKKPLHEIWLMIKGQFLEGTTLDFNVGNQPIHRSSLYAPTEECPVRKRLIQGEVHDLNAWSLGGVAPHAGLFGSIDDVSWYLLQLRSQYLGIARYSIKQKTAQFFAKRAIPEVKGDWSLGFMMPTPGEASCGNYFSLDSFGHLGFTGTSLWYDPKLDLGVVILSNRVLYGAENRAFSKLRPVIHNMIVENFRRSSG